MKKRLLFLIIIGCLVGCYACGPNPNPNLDPASVRGVRSMAGQVLSNLNVSDIEQDPLGYIWISTARGLNRFNGHEYTQYFRNASDSNTLWMDNIMTLYMSDSEGLWVGTQRGVNHYDQKRDVFVRYASEHKMTVVCFAEDKSGNIYYGSTRGIGHVDRSQQELVPITDSLGSVGYIHCDSDGILWIAMGERPGLARFDPASKTLIYVHAEGIRCRTILELPDGRFWVDTNRGCKLFDPKTQTFSDPEPELAGGKQFPQDIVKSFRSRGSQTIYLLTRAREIFAWDPYSSDGELKQVSGLEFTTPGDINTIFSDRDGNVWVGTFDDGYKFVPKNKRQFCPDSVLAEKMRGCFITRITSRGDDPIWIGTRYDGIYQYDELTQRFRHFLIDDLFPIVQNPAIRVLFSDSRHRLWIGVDNVLLCCSEKNGTLLSNARFNTNGVLNSLYEDSQGNIWITAGVLYLLPQGDIGGNPVKMYPFTDRKCNITDVIRLRSGEVVFSCFSEGLLSTPMDVFNPKPLLSGDSLLNSLQSSVISLFEDTSGSLWVGSYSNGLLRYEPGDGSCKIYGTTEGLPSNDVIALSEDGQGNIWFSTSFGLCCLNENTGSCINYFTTDGIPGNQYHERAVYKDGKGQLYFGGNYGITFFDPVKMQNDNSIPRIIIEDLEINNKSVQSGMDDSPLRNHIAYEKEIVLSHQDNPVGFEFTGIDYQAPGKLRYTYILEGFDPRWSMPDFTRRVSYSNLPFGRYTFKVNVINEGGILGDSPAVLQVRVLPPPWLSWWAISLYVLLIGAVVYVLIRLLLNNHMNRVRLQIAEENRAKDAEIHNLKINFFTNISHELRTPLSLIYGPLQEVLKAGRFSSQNARYLSLIQTNVNRLMRLIDQLLDFSRLDSDTLSLQVREVDFVPLMRRIVETFEEYAAQKGMTLTFCSEPQSLPIMADEDKVEKIFSNLLSNALKYNTEGGAVVVRLDLRVPDGMRQEGVQPDCAGQVHVSVEDNGIGVEPAELPYIFDRFRRLSSGTPSIGGNGIGLNYTKRLVEEHKGQIIAALNPEKGMTFHVVLPLSGKGFWMNEQLAKVVPEPEVRTFRGDEALETTEGRPTILIIEDEPGMQQFLREILGSQYRLLNSFDGLDGVNAALEELPDLILSDCLMPRMDGYEVCEKIKTHPATCHIPVVLLTAKSAVADQIKGVQRGADVYIPKPFDTEYLLSVIRTTIQNRMRMQQLVSVNPHNVSQLDVQDKRFMEKLNTRLDTLLNDPELNINMLAAEMGFSRTTFYRKIKALTGQTPNDFLRLYRLHRAADLIRGGDHTLSEVSDLTGFCTHSHFSATFKKQFGVSPREYKESGK